MLIAAHNQADAVLEVLVDEGDAAAEAQVGRPLGLRSQAWLIEFEKSSAGWFPMRTWCQIMSRPLQAVVTLMFVAAAHVSSIAANIPPPDSPFSEQNWKSTLPVPPASGVQFGTLRVDFEKTTLGDVQTAVGEGTIEHQGDAGGSVYWLCYTVAAKSRAERIWIVSHGEMGGADHEVTGVNAKLSGVRHGTASCPALPGRFLPARIDHHLWLRSSARDVEKALGAPSHSASPWVSFDFEGKIQGKCDGGFDRLTGLTLRVENGIVTALQASQVTSC